MPRIGLVTSTSVLRSGSDQEIHTIQSSMRDSGLDSTVVAWDDDVSWPNFDYLILRSPWDYASRFEEFSRWLKDISKHTRVVNSPELVRWNLDKRYLFDLADRGVRIVPSTLCPDLTTCGDAIAAHVSQVVVKPTVSNSSQLTGLFSTDDPRALGLCEEIFSLGKQVLVQPAIDAIQDDAERCLLFFGGKLSHTVQKCAILEAGGGYRGGHYRTITRPAVATSDELALAEQTLSAIGQIAEERGWSVDAQLPLYLRVDLVTPHDGQPMLLEAELFEPGLHLRHSEGGTDRFVRAVHCLLAQGEN